MQKVKTKSALMIAMFAALTCVGAFIKIPMVPVPLTLQLLFTALAGVILGARKAAVSQLVYVLLGLLGLPVFTMGGGISYVWNPTFGYLIGLIPAAFIIGALTKNNITFLRIVLACLAGFAVVYILGASYLYMIQNFYLQKNYTLQQTLISGIVMFLPGDMIKIFAVCINVKYLARFRLN